MARLATQLKAPNGLEFSLPTGLFIDNEFVESSSGANISSFNPATGQEICSVEAASAADVDRAVKAARAAFQAPSWRDLAGGARAALMLRLADMVEQHQRVLATIETWDNGKPFLVALDADLPEVVACLRYYAGWADKLHGQTIPTTKNKLAYTLRQPVGVCAQIIPWGYPTFPIHASTPRGGQLLQPTRSLRIPPDKLAGQGIMQSPSLSLARLRISLKILAEYPCDRQQDEAFLTPQASIVNESERVSEACKPGEERLTRGR